MKKTATQSLVSCLLDMAEAETNPVLQVIPSDLTVKENKKYPPKLLQFKGLGWRAYYHCHPASRVGNHRFKGEHGHFHIFVRIQNEPEKWSHLVALAMDNMGQPLGWFTVNHWVTGEDWESASNLVTYLKQLPFSEQEKGVEKWLLSLLSFDHEQVEGILYERDEIIELKQSLEQDNDVKKDKNIYLLSEIPIKLKELLGMNI